MKILVDLRPLRSTTLDGIGRVALSYVAEWLRAPHGNRFALLFASEPLRRFGHDWIQRYDARRLQADFITLLAPHNNTPTGLIKLLRLPYQWQPDVLFSPHFAFSPLPGPWKRVAMVHDLIPLLFPEHFTQASTPFRLLLTRPEPQRLLLNRLDTIVTVSENTRRDLIGRLGLAPNRIEVVHNGVHPETPLEPLPASIPTASIMCISRPDPYKNLAGLIRAYALLPAPLRQAHPLVLAGPHDARYTPVLQQQIVAAGLQAQVHLPGPVANAVLPSLYSSCAVFAFPSLYEGFGLPPLEAMAYGAPVVCSDRASLPEVVGEAAALVNPEDAPTFAAALERVLTDATYRQTLVIQGQVQAKKFRWQTQAEQLLSLLTAY